MRVYYKENFTEIKINKFYSSWLLCELNHLHKCWTNLLDKWINEVTIEFNITYLEYSSLCFGGLTWLVFMLSHPDLFLPIWRYKHGNYRNFRNPTEILLSLIQWKYILSFPLHLYHWAILWSDNSYNIT